MSNSGQGSPLSSAVATESLPSSPSYSRFSDADINAMTTRELLTYDDAPVIESVLFTMADLRRTYDYLSKHYSTPAMKNIIRNFNMTSRQLETLQLREAPRCAPVTFPLNAEQRAAEKKRLMDILERKRKVSPDETVLQSDYQELICAFRKLTYEDRATLESLIQPTGVLLGRGAAGSVQEFSLTLPNGSEAVAENLAVKNFESETLPEDLKSIYKPIVHETFIATEGISRVYATGICPAVFSISWGLANCGNSNRRIEGSHWCADGDGEVGVQEVYTGQSINAYLSTSTVMNLKQLVAIFLLVADGLKVAFDTIRFSHRDLHPGNVLLIDPKYNVSDRVHGINVRLSNGRTLFTSVMPKIIDYGSARMELDDKTYGNFMGFRFGIRPAPMADMVLLILRTLGTMQVYFSQDMATNQFIDVVLSGFCAISSSQLDEWLGSKRAASGNEPTGLANTAPLFFDNQSVEPLIAHLLAVYDSIGEDQFVIKISRQQVPAVISLALPTIAPQDFSIQQRAFEMQQDQIAQDLLNEKIAQRVERQRLERLERKRQREQSQSSSRTSTSSSEKSATTSSSSSSGSSSSSSSSSSSISSPTKRPRVQTIYDPSAFLQNLS